MTAMSMKNFTGMTPRAPDHLLEDSAAAYAANCDFSRGVLAALKYGQEVLNWGSIIRGMYTDDGVSWYTWPAEVVAYKSPVINEMYGRLYYIENNRLKVTVTPENAIPAARGGPPPANMTWYAGVPNPTKAPTLTVLDRNTLPDYPGAYIDWAVWWTDGAVNYDADVPQDVWVDSLWRRYQIVPKPKSDSVPASAILVVRAIAKDTKGQQLFMMNTQVGAAPAASTALPGGLTMTLAVDTGTPPAYFIHFDWGVVETRAYVFTDQNTWDEEGGPSPVSLISPTYMQDVQVVMETSNFTGYKPRKQSNVYRTYGGSQYIKASSLVGDGNYIFKDEARTVQSGTGTSLPSLTWVPPPDPLSGLVLAPNGWFAAFKANTLYMSEPYRPHAWPYSMAFPKTITGICVSSQVIVVTTMEATYVVTGPHPHSATSMRLPIPAGGISQKSMCAVEGGVAFLSNDGIVMVEGSQASLDINKRYFTREVWRNLFGDVLPSMMLAYHDGCIVVVNSDTGPPLNLPAKGFVLDLDDAGGAMTRYNFPHTAMLRLSLFDTLYFAEAGRIYRFREGIPLTAEWESKQFITPDYTKLGIGFARMSGAGQIFVNLYADEQFVQKLTLEAANRTTYSRLKPHPGALKWQIKISLAGTAKLEDIAFAHTMEELKGV